MDWIVVPQNSYVEVLMPNVIVFGERAFVDVVWVKWGHMVGPNLLGCWPCKKRKNFFSLPFPSPPPCTEEWPHEDTGRRHLTSSQEESPHKKLNPVWHDLGLFSLWNCEKIHVYCISHRLYVICYSNPGWLTIVSLLKTGQYSKAQVIW